MADENVRKSRGARIPGICTDAAALNVSRFHLFECLKGRRKSPKLIAKYQASQKRIPPPIEVAALENLESPFFEHLQAIHLEVVIIRFEAGKESPIWLHHKIEEDLDKELQKIKAGVFDSSAFPLGAQLHVFHVNSPKLGEAIRLFKETLATRGLLKVSRIYHAEKKDSLRVWLGDPGAGDAVQLDTENDA